MKLEKEEEIRGNTRTYLDEGNRGEIIQSEKGVGEINTLTRDNWINYIEMDRISL